ncbi:Poly(U)-binding-splicing factor puf60 [Mortierella alpina]|nr:Poly(U)-binding-splicing factor puf60 [Mortierella alpina]
MQDSSNNDTVNDRKRSIGGTEEEDLAMTTAGDITKDVDGAVKKARLDQDGDAPESDVNSTSVDGSITEEDPANKGKSHSPASFWCGNVSSRNANALSVIDSEPSEARDPHTGLTETQTLALERAKQYAREIQEQLASAGTISSVSEPEPALAIANVMEQRKSLCRVYVGSISFEATEDDVRQKLSRFGAIKELVLKVDPATGKHRGFCFVEYDLPEAAILAVQASESVDVGGRHLKIGRPKNYDADAIKDLPPPPEDRIYVANIGSLVSEPDLAGIFAAFGEVEKCVLLPDPVTRKHKGYGYVQFKSGTDINTIVDSMKGFMLLDMPMGVCKAIVGGVLPEGMKSLDSLPLTTAQLQMPTQARVPQTASTTIVNPAMIARATATAASTAQRLVAMGQSSGASGLNGDRESVASEENMSISGNQRYMVMQSLARSSGLVPPAAAAIPAPLSHVVQPTVVRLQYSATPADIDDQLEEEFKEECSKYGPVIQVQMLPLADGLLRIFIQFASPVDARSAAAQLNGRQFDGKTIQATLFDQQEYIAGRLV